MIREAVITDEYRFSLWRIWDQDKPNVFWLMHNPSTADANKDDATIRRIIRYSQDWGYGGLCVGNLSPQRTSDKKLVREVDGETDWLNGLYLHSMMKKSKIWVHAYGVPSFKMSLWFYRTFIKIPPTRTHYLTLTKGGYPSHPLRLSAQLKPKPYNV